MPFAVFSHQSNGFEQIILEDSITLTRIIILPEHGALLHAFIIQNNNDAFNIIDHYPDRKTLDAELGSTFKGSKLSPFPCRVSSGKYSHNDHPYQLKNRGNDGSFLHGLLYNKPFKEAGNFSDDFYASVQLKYNYKRDDPGYPFEYRCEVVYQLHPDNILFIQTTIFNLDKEAIPLADGWHPYFKLGGKTDEWLLRFNCDGMIELGEDLVPTGRLLPYSSFNQEMPIGERVFDHCFLLNRNDNFAACTLFNPENKVSVGFFPDQSYPYLLIYTPPQRLSIAIENLSAPPDCFNNKMGLLLLPPGHSKTFSIYYKIGTE